MSLVEQKVAEYNQYIDSHCANVWKAYNQACTLFGRESVFINSEKTKLLMIRVMNHDKSKYSKEEFDPYRRHWHSINEEEKKSSEEDYQKAWEHHYSVNDHHWEHYRIGSDLIKSDDNYKEIPELALFELILDWWAMGIAKGGNPREFYYMKKEKGEYFFNPKTRLELERLLEYFSD